MEAKGKTDVVSAWLAVEPVSVCPSSSATSCRLVGRDAEAVALRDALDRSRREPSTQLVSVIGEPGIGKTRLVEELRSYIEEAPDLITWRRGRSLAYGDGVAFWALGEMVKAQAGILESDSAAVAQEKLAEAVGEVIVDERDRGWVAPHLRPLVGLGGCAGWRGWRPGGGVCGLASVRRGAGRGRADGAGVRGHPLGRRRLARLHRADRRSRRGGAAADRVYRPAGAVWNGASVGAVA